ncbi:unnamed protein product [Rodentolepis nana]|uniref:Protein OSCP1 n=1 Tax=Rodentolepis nana TaxID=102285 RepID=A0A0R3U0D5_RODNA|nr:unnamed protein product [Rodentolepis nana]
MFPSGRSRVLLNQDGEANFKVHVKNEPQESPVSIAKSMDSFEDDDEIPVIKTKIKIMNRSSKGGSLVLPTFEEGDQFDPFILPVNTEKNTDERTLESYNGRLGGIFSERNRQTPSRLSKSNDCPDYRLPEEQIDLLLQVLAD